MSISRRTFLTGASALGAITLRPTPLLASALSWENEEALTNTQELPEGWEFFRGSLDPRFQVWHSSELVTWEAVTVPHCFNHYDACDPEVPAYRGPGWYRLKLPVQNPFPHGRTLLHVEGAGQRAAVYVGTTLCGTHEGGYDEFMVDITDACEASKPGTPVPLAVFCDNSRDIDALPSDLSDFTLYGGLYRPVHLCYVPAVSLEAVHTEIHFTPGSSAEVRVTARLYAPGVRDAPLQLTSTVRTPSGEALSPVRATRTQWQGEAEIARFTLPNPTLWSPDHPALYQCEVTLSTADGESRTSHRFGIRHTHFVEHGPFELNGERLLLRGTHRHEDHAAYAAAIPEDVLRREMQMIKDMGANFIRLAHYQQRRLVLELCDALGLLVWEEVPWCRSGVASEKFKAQGKRLLETMIDQHRNHPCVLVWGLGNEDDWPSEPQGKDHAAIRAYMQELRELAHSLDSTRLTSFRRCDFARDIPDVYSPSIWAGWYSGRYTEYRAALEKARMTVPHLLHVEWGADSHAGRHAEEEDAALAAIQTGQGTAEQGFDYKLTGGSLRMAKDSAWTESYACELFDWYLKTMEEVPWLTGAAQWAFKDFTTPLRVDNPVPRVNQKGLVERDLTPKEGYFVFQSRWAKTPMLHIYGHNWPVRWGRDGQKRKVHVYSNCSAVELFLNGVSAGVRQREASKFPAAGLLWEVAFRPGPNELRAESRQTGVALSDQIAFEYQAEPWGQPARILLAKARSEPQRTTLRAKVVDAAGLVCLDARAVVRFGVTGSATLIDNLGTVTGSRVVQLCNGRAEITVEVRGRAVVSVTTEHLEPAFVEVGD